MTVDNARLKILVVSTSFPLSTDSYSGIFVKRIIDHLPTDMHVTVLTPAADREFTTTSSANISVVKFRYAPASLQILANRPGGIPAALRTNRLNYLLLPFFLGAMLFQTWRLGRHHDVIHANWAICGFIGGIAGKLLNRPVIASFMGSDVMLAQTSRPHRLLLEFCLRQLNHVVCVSNDMRAGICRAYPQYAEKLSVITNGVDSSLLNFHRNYGERELPVIISVGSLVPVKGYDITLRALSAISDRIKFRFLCIGDGSEKPALQAMAGAGGLEDAVIFRGAVAPERVYQEMYNADIFILSSRSEGMPNVMLEAMACALPVIASNIDGVAEVIHHQENGLLFEKENAGQLAGLIELLAASSELRERLGNSARLTIQRSNMTWNSTAAAYLQIYRRVTGKAAG